MLRSPLGLLALLALVPLVVLYLIQPDPERLPLPTLRFLTEREGTDSANPLFERLRRNALLILQALALVLFALVLAAPAVMVPEGQVVDETVVVLDASASMGVESGGTTRFERAKSAALDDVSATTSVVVAGAAPRVLVRRGTRTEARRALEGVERTDTPGDLRSAVAQASVLAGENARIVVLSDFADDSGWRDEVRAARAGDRTVALSQFGGGRNRAGIVDRSFSGRTVTFTIRSYAAEPITRTVELGGTRRRVELGPGDIELVTLPVPAGGGRARLGPGDDFATDDVAYIVAPADPTVETLLLTNGGDRYLRTALEVIEAVDLTVMEPPGTIQSEYDVVVYGDVRSDRLLRSNVAAGRDTLERGGGVVVRAQRTPPEYGDLLLVEPSGTGVNPTIGRVADDDRTADISFPPPSEYVRGDLRTGEALVSTSDGTPLVAVGRVGNGRVLYYGYLADASPFRFNFQYPVFWKRAVFSLAGREPLADINRETGTRLAVGNNTTVSTPTGTATGPVVTLDRTGVYADGSRRIGVSLFDAGESNVTAPSLDGGTGEGGGGIAREERLAPRPLDGPVALVALLVVVTEVAYLRRRGDL